MPLSEHEERQLQEIARRLSQDDPQFVATVSNENVARMQLRRLRWAVAGFFVGLGLLLGLSFHFALGVIGFAVMLASVLLGARAGRTLGSSPLRVVEELRRGSRGRGRS
jgi:hypothetical protein